MARLILCPLLLSLLLINAGCAREKNDPEPVILAPASMENLLLSVATTWENEGNSPLALSFAGTATHARQIERGAPADLFISADAEWIDRLASERLVDPDSIRDIAAGALVLIAPGPKGRQRDMINVADLDHLLGANGKLAIADIKAVPAGRYAAEALSWLGADAISRNRLAESDNVRGALRLVETGEAAAGIVYATDARISEKVHTVFTFPDAAHLPIRYLGARLVSSDNVEARRFLDWLGSTKAQAALSDYGFRQPSDGATPK